MESATPKHFKSSVLAALDVKPNPENFEIFNPFPTQRKRKLTPGSPDPRNPKRVASGVRPNIPGLENILCRRFSITYPICIIYLTLIQSLQCCSLHLGRQVYRRIIVKNLAYTTTKMHQYLVSTLLPRINKNSKVPLCRRVMALTELHYAHRLATFVSKAIDNVAEKITVKEAMEHLGIKT